jgi:NAD(P)-dependent dehydrogenase (short-subunit alcohol dehydrogenase family)
MGISDKVAVVTGGGRGIGRAIALAFSREGAKVAVWARTEEQVAAVAGEILEAGGVAAHYVVDVADEKTVAEAVERVEAELGQIDILVNNAAEMRLASVTGTTTAIWDRLMRSNARGPFVCCRAVLPGMMERRRGRIINIGSLAGRRGYEAQAAYCASKHALVGFSKALAIEAQPYGIHVNMVSPGGVVTELSRELRESRGAENPTDWMTAEEVADAVLYIVNQEGAAVTDELVLRRFASEPWR